MLKNYLLIAFRNIRREKLFTLIKVLGLALGIAACLTIYQLVTYELRFDTFHPNKDRIYRVYTEYSGNYIGLNPGVASGLPVAMEEGIPGIEAFAHIYMEEFPTVNTGENGKTFREAENVLFTPAEFFQIFSSYEWLAGNPETALKQPYQVVLTDERAAHYFGDKDLSTLIGKTLSYEDSLTVQISGIVKAFEKPSDFVFTEFVSFNTLEASWMRDRVQLNEWMSTTSSSQLFILLSEGVGPEQIEPHFEGMLEPYKPEYEEIGWEVAYLLQPLSNIHFNPDMGLFNSGRSPVHLPTLWGVMGIAVLLLLIASINYINLATAQAFRRGKEVGVRKVLGGTPQNLMLQFLSETFLISFFAVMLSVAITELSFGLFTEFFPKGLEFEAFSWRNGLFYLGIATLLSLLAGGYPAFLMSRFSPDKALKSSNQSLAQSGGVSLLRKGLIVIQFAASITLIIATLFSSRQIHYLMHKDMGFKKDEILTFSVPFFAEREKQGILYQELKKLPEIEKISIHNRPPSSRGYNTSHYTYEKDGQKIQEELHVHRIDTNYFSLYDIPLVAGRGLLPSDTLKEFVVNETFVQHAGLERPEEALGMTIHDEEVSYPIVGVVQDFHHRPLSQKISPLLLGMGNVKLRFGVKLHSAGMKTGDMKALIAKIEENYLALYPSSTFSYQFYDETIAKFYEEEQRLSKLTQTATGIAIFLSCMGLFGLISIAVVRRTKEIGIRKVLGASVQQIVALLSREFLILVGISFIIASPVAYYVVIQWLKGFAYHIPVEVWLFLVAGLLTVVVAFLTISAQSVRAARANPIESLRTE